MTTPVALEFGESRPVPRLGARRRQDRLGDEHHGAVAERRAHGGAVGRPRSATRSGSPCSARCVQDLDVDADRRPAGRG